MSTIRVTSRPVSVGIQRKHAYLLTLTMKVVTTSPVLVEGAQALQKTGPKTRYVEFPYPSLQTVCALYCYTVYPMPTYVFLGYGED